MTTTLNAAHVGRALADYDGNESKRSKLKTNELQLPTLLV